MNKALILPQMDQAVLEFRSFHIACRSSFNYLAKTFLRGNPNHGLFEVL